MTIFAKIRLGFTIALGDILHEYNTIVAVTEAEFEGIAHKVEVIAEDVLADLHLAKGHALAVSPAVGAAMAGGVAPTLVVAPVAAAAPVEPVAATETDHASVDQATPAA
ncbi:MAG: hypothetical protein POG24_09115 [Acidocella sp.]|nr:hypothetical protein [Acidocella sp.]MDE8350211.1 hypothetical protein [Acidocella sp.]